MDRHGGQSRLAMTLRLMNGTIALARLFQSAFQRRVIGEAVLKQASSQSRSLRRVHSIPRSGLLAGRGRQGVEARGTLPGRPGRPCPALGTGGRLRLACKARAAAFASANRRGRLRFCGSMTHVTGAWRL